LAFFSLITAETNFIKTLPNAKIPCSNIKGVANVLITIFGGKNGDFLENLLWLFFM
jgi:hypothetical protein